jgi:hypothetical protein
MSKKEQMVGYLFGSEQQLGSEGVTLQNFRKFKMFTYTFLHILHLKQVSDNMDHK